MSYAGPKRFERLPGKRSPALVDDGHRKHEWDTPVELGEHFFDPNDARLQVQCVKHRFREQHIHSPLEQCPRLFSVCCFHFIEGDRARPWILDVRRHAEGLVEWSKRSRYKPRLAWIQVGELGRGFLGDAGTLAIDLGNIASRLKRTLRFDGKTEQFIGDNEANQLLTRTYREGHWASLT